MFISIPPPAAASSRLSQSQIYCVLMNTRGILVISCPRGATSIVSRILNERVIEVSSTTLQGNCCQERKVKTFGSKVLAADRMEFLISRGMFSLKPFLDENSR